MAVRRCHLPLKRMATSIFGLVEDITYNSSEDAGYLVDGNTGALLSGGAPTNDYKIGGMRKEMYEIPVGTKVEIISEGSRYNGRIGTLGAGDPSGMPAHNVWFDNDEFDCFMDYEFLPVQNIITIDNLEYETLCKIFEHDYLYETDRIVVKQKKFSEEEIETALAKYTGQLSKAFSVDSDIDEFILNDRGKILDLLINMLDETYDGEFSTAIEDAVMYEQWWIEGFRKHLTWRKDNKPPCYFNPEANIETVFI